MIQIWNGRPVSNSLSVFNYYKRLTGRSVESDLIRIERQNKVLSNPKASSEEVEKAINECGLDNIEVLQGLYYSMRCAAEGKELDYAVITDELTMDDLTNGSIEKLIEMLVNVKKKKQTKRFWAKR